MILVDIANFVPFFKEEFIKMSYDLEPKFMQTFKKIGYYQLNKKKLAQYLKLCATVEPISPSFPSLYIVESGFSHVQKEKTFKHRTW